MSFFVKAAVEALKRYPIVNSSVEGNDIVYHDYYDIGLAVSTDRGLVVPVLRGDDADSLAARVLTQEHLIYPRAITGLLSNR
jgi:2-oxoglutarate dehydrogenase E2 component (dihydrolipoamide succinyltransferase)